MTEIPPKKRKFISMKYYLSYLVANSFLNND